MCKEAVFEMLSAAVFHIFCIQKKLRISKRAWSKTCLWTFYNMQVSLCSIFVTIYASHPWSHIYISLVTFRPK